MLSTLILPLIALAYAPTPEMVSSPALLVDYTTWSKRGEEFRKEGSETRLFRELVEILYDRDIQRPWGPQYFPEANRRLTAFRTSVCKAVPSLAACFRPASLMSDADVTTLQKNILDPASLAALGARWNVALAPWSLPLREPVFSLLAGPAGESFARELAAWDLSGTVKWNTVAEPFLYDVTNYLAGFENHDAPALFAGTVLNDWQLRDRSMDFAHQWKHAIYANHSWVPSNPIADDKEIQFQRMFEENAPRFAQVYEEQLALVKDMPQHLARFRRERAGGDYPDETYQRVAYEQLRELVELQGSYLSLADSGRKQTSARQKVLESLLLLQRYTKSPRVFAMEITTLMEPLTSHAYVLDEMGDYSLGQTYVLEMLKAILGLDVYQEPLFPKYGAGLKAPILFDDAFLTENAPDLKQALGGRDYSKLPSDEQLKLLQIYLVPSTGKVRPMGLFRLAAAWLSSADIDELRALAERVHEARKGNFK